MIRSDTSKWKLHHTCVRVRQPQRSIQFYQFLGMTQVNHLSLPDMKLDLFFLAYTMPGKDVSGNPYAYWGNQEGVLELLHNYGSEDDPNFKVASGNEDDGKGFGHICVSVDNLEAACHRLEEAGHKFQKRPTDGQNPNIAFVLDPDGYWVELIRQKSAAETKGMTTTDLESYRLNHTMLRVKSGDVSLKFYQDILGMKLLGTLDIRQAGYTLYFMGYAETDAEMGGNVLSTAGVNKLAGREGLLELRWEHGTEKLDGRIYHSGNETPLGFGHLAFAVDDLLEACSLMEERKVTWVKRLTDPPADQYALFQDADGYWIELIQNQRMVSSSS